MSSSSLFDSVLSEASRAERPEVRSVLQAILKTRDQVTTAIAKVDPSLGTVLTDNERNLRQALGYAVSGTVSLRPTSVDLA